MFKILIIWFSLLGIHVLQQYFCKNVILKMIQSKENPKKYLEVYPKFLSMAPFTIFSINVFFSLLELLLHSLLQEFAFF